MAHTDQIQADSVSIAHVLTRSSHVNIIQCKGRGFISLLEPSEIQIPDEKKERETEESPQSSLFQMDSCPLVRKVALHGDNNQRPLPIIPCVVDTALGESVWAVTLTSILHTRPGGAGLLHQLPRHPSIAAELEEDWILG